MGVAALNLTLNQNYKLLQPTLAVLNEVAVWRDKFTTLHEARVGKIVQILALDIGLSRASSEILGRACGFHDIGKFGVPEAILHKKGALTAEEFAVIQSHSHIGAAIFRKAKGPFCELAAAIALVHHEKMDGSGYPYGLKGHQISLEGRLIAVADVYDALRSTRDYKSSMTHSAAARTIISGDNRTRPEHFDEKILRAFERCSDQLQEIYIGEPNGVADVKPS